MACGGHTTYNRGCSGQVCSGNGVTINPRTSTSWVDNISVGERLKLNVFKQMQSALNTEVSSRKLSNSWTSISTGDRVRLTVLNELTKCINNCRSSDISKSLASGSFSWTTLNVGDKLKNAFLTQLRNNINTLQKVCLCNCDYCTCNCNYCTCNCNYSCTCDCNYSDSRLKINITYL